MVDVVEGSFYIGIEYKFGFVSDTEENRFDSIVTGAAWTKAIAIGFKNSLPGRL